MSLRDEFFKKFEFILSTFNENISFYYISEFNSLGINYLELNRVSCKLSEYFSGVCEGGPQYIGVSLSDYCFLPCIILAIWKSGNSFAGAGEQYTKKSTLYFLDFLQVNYLINDNIKIDYGGKIISSFGIHDRTFYIWRRYPPVQESGFSNFKDICYGIMTSGTTAEPKIIQVPWSCILPNVIELSHEFQVNDTDCIFQASPYSFDPFFVELLMTFLNGCSLMIVSNSLKLHPPNLLKTLFKSSKKNVESPSFCSDQLNYFSIQVKPGKKTGATILQVTPSVLKRWTDSEIQNFLLSPETTLRILILGGEKFPNEILKLKHPANTTKIFNIYGITEISCWAFLNEVTNFRPEADVTLGKALNNIVYKVSENGEFFIGSKARICIVDKETLLPAEEVIFRNTGDVIKVINEQLLYIGRSNQIVKKYGLKINLSEIENSYKINNKLMKDCYCLFDEDSLVLGLFFMPVENSLEGMHYKVLTYEDFCERGFEIPEKELKDIEKPDYLIEFSEIPLNAHGKCDRVRMLHKLKDLCSTQKPQSDLESAFSRLWAKALGVKQFGLFSLGFKELGGNSVCALDIINSLNDSGFHVPQNLITELLSGKNYASCLKCLTLAAEKSGGSQKRFKPNVKSSDFKLSVRWKFDLGKCIDATPSVFTFQGEEKIVIGSHSSQLSCLRSTSGEEIWSRYLGDRIESGFTPTADGSKGFIGCYDHFVYCLSCADGSVIWKFKTNDMVKSTPCLSSDGRSVFVGSYDKNLYRLSSADGRVEQSLRLSNGSIFCSGVVSGTLNTFYTATLDGTCVAISQETNRIKWKTVVASPVFASPRLIPQRNEILFSEVLGNVHCLSAIDGSKMWTFKADGNIYSSPVVENLSIIFGCHDSHLYCLQYEERPELKWKQELDSHVYSSPAIVSGSSVCVASTKGVIYICDLSEGSVKSQLKLQGEVFSSPVCHISQLFVGCRDNNIYCVDVSDT